MKRLSLFIAVIVTALATTMPANALGLHVGPRIGVDINSLHFSKDVFDANNRAGFTGGLELNLSVPFGFALDASIMYARRAIDGNFKFGNESIDGKNIDYINVPVNIEWGLNLPLVSKIIVPYIYTGPDFAFRVSKAGVTDAWKDHKVDVAWDFGIGVQLIKKLRISATYGMGITKWANWAGVTSLKNDDTARTNCWTVTAAWLF